MSNGPTPGNELPKLIIEDGHTVYYSGMVQSSANQFVQLKDSKGNVIFTMEGASKAPNDGSGQAAAGSPTWLQGGSFETTDLRGEYTLSIGTYGGERWSQVLWDQDEISLDGKVYFHRYTFISEDSAVSATSGDHDYNDSYVSLHWFRYSD